MSYSLIFQHHRINAVSMGQVTGSDDYNEGCLGKRGRVTKLQTITQVVYLNFKNILNRLEGQMCMYLLTACSTVNWPAIEMCFHLWITENDFSFNMI